MTSSNKSRSKLHEMVVRGTNFRDHHEIEMYGEPVTVIMQPLVDDEFLPIAAFLSSHFDMEEIDDEEAVSEAIDKVDEARPESNLEDVEGVGDGMAEALSEEGFEAPGDVADAEVDELTEVDGIGNALAERLQEDAADAAVDDTIDISQLDEEFVGIMQSAAQMSITGALDEDGNEVEHDEEEVEFMVENMMGGYSVELGSHALEISGDVRDAEKFRGGRGRVERSRDS